MKCKNEMYFTIIKQKPEVTKTYNILLTKIQVKIIYYAEMQMSKLDMKLDIKTIHVIYIKTIQVKNYFFLYQN